MAQVYRPSDESELESVRGDGAARRRAVLDLLFFCCAGDVERSQEIVRTWGIDVSPLFPQLQSNLSSPP